EVHREGGDAVEVDRLTVERLEKIERRREGRGDVRGGAAARDGGHRAPLLVAAGHGAERRRPLEETVVVEARGGRGVAGGELDQRGVGAGWRNDQPLARRKDDRRRIRVAVLRDEDPRDRGTVDRLELELEEAVVRDVREVPDLGLPRRD